MKALIVHYCSDDCYDQRYDNPSIHPPIVNAVCESYIKIEKLEPETQSMPHMEARINDKGEPYIYKWSTYKPYMSYNSFEERLLKFKEDGFNHTEEKYEDERGVPHWVYTRKVKKYLWWVEIATIEQLEELIKSGGNVELEEVQESPIPDCKYILRI